MALSFNGVDQGVEMPLVSSASTFAVTSLWAFPRSTGGEQVMFNNGRDDPGVGGDGYTVEIESGNWKLLLNGKERDDSGIAVVPNIWYHIGIVVGTGVELFLNGSAIVTTSTGPNTPTARTTIGAQWDNTAGALWRFFDGMVAEVAMWEDITSSDAMALLKTGIRPPYLSPIGLGKRKCYLPLARGQRNQVDSGVAVLNRGGTYAPHPPLIHPAFPVNRPMFADVGAGGATVYSQVWWSGYGQGVNL